MAISWVVKIWLFGIVTSSLGVWTIIINEFRLNAILMHYSQQNNTCVHLCKCKTVLPHAAIKPAKTLKEKPLNVTDSKRKVKWYYSSKNNL